MEAFAYVLLVGMCSLILGMFIAMFRDFDDAKYQWITAIFFSVFSTIAVCGQVAYNTHTFKFDKACSLHQINNLKVVKDGNRVFHFVMVEGYSDEVDMYDVVVCKFVRPGLQYCLFSFPEEVRYKVVNKEVARKKYKVDLEKVYGGHPA